MTGHAERPTSREQDEHEIQGKAFTCKEASTARQHKWYWLQKLIFNFNFITCNLFSALGKSQVFGWAACFREKQRKTRQRNALGKRRKFNDRT